MGPISKTHDYFNWKYVLSGILKILKYKYQQKSNDRRYVHSYKTMPPIGIEVFIPSQTVARIQVSSMINLKL
jgi:hypothetical protein